MPWETPPPLCPILQKGERHISTAYDMLYIPWMVILGDYGSKKKSFENSDFQLRGVKNCTSRLCTNPLGEPLGDPSPWPKGEKHMNMG